MRKFRDEKSGALIFAPDPVDIEQMNLKERLKQAEMKLQQHEQMIKQLQQTIEQLKSKGAN